MPDSRHNRRVGAGGRRRVARALTAMHSWIAVASLALLLPWLFIGTMQRRRNEAHGWHASSTSPRNVLDWIRLGWSPGLSAVAIGAVAGGLLTAGWLLNATDISELSERVAFRTGNDVSTAAEQAQFTFGEFLQRQWTFASHELLTSWWLRLLFFPALIAAFVDRRTRGPALVTSRGRGVTHVRPAAGGVDSPVVELSLGGSHGDRCRSPRPMPCDLAFAAGPCGCECRWVCGCSGGIGERWCSLPPVPPATSTWTAPPMPGQSSSERWKRPRSPRLSWCGSPPASGLPRWIAYYLDRPAWMLDKTTLDDVDPATDVILVRNDRVPKFVPPSAMAEPLAAGEDYTLITAAALFE